MKSACSTRPSCSIVDGVEVVQHRPDAWNMASLGIEGLRPTAGRDVRHTPQRREVESRNPGHATLAKIRPTRAMASWQESVVR